MAIEFINLTPHKINIQTGDGDEVGGITIPPSGTVARVVIEEQVLGLVPGTKIKMVARRAGAVAGLPEETPNTVFIVSAMTLDHCPGRGDVFAPDTGATAVRDDNGHIQAVRRLVAAPPA